MYNGGENLFVDFLNLLSEVERDVRNVEPQKATELLQSLESACKDLVTVLTRSVDLAPEYTPEQLIKQKWLVVEVLERVRSVIARIRMATLLIQRGALKKLFDLGAGTQYIARQYFDASLSVFDESYPHLSFLRDVLQTIEFALESLLDCLEIKRQFMLRQIEAKLKITPQAV